MNRTTLLPTDRKHTAQHGRITARRPHVVSWTLRKEEPSRGYKIPSFATLVAIALASCLVVYLAGMSWLSIQQTRAHQAEIERAYAPGPYANDPLRMLTDEELATLEAAPGEVDYAAMHTRLLARYIHKHLLVPEHALAWEPVYQAVLGSRDTLALGKLNQNRLHWKTEGELQKALRELHAKLTKAAGNAE